MKIAVLGSGSWGTALAVLLAAKGNDIFIWNKSAEKAKILNSQRENREYLPNVTLKENIRFTSEMKDCILGAELIVMAVPSHAVREVSKKASEFVLEGQIVLNVAKGFEADSLKRLSVVIKEELPTAKIAVMSGPSHAEEVSKFLPTTNVVSGEDMKVCEKIQRIFMHPTFRVYTNDDLLGVEIGGALKNVIALAAGISAGLGCGDNALAALMTRGIAEISRLGVAMGAKPLTFSGLTGIGDLIVTCMSKHSRNRRAGVLIGQGVDVREAIDRVQMVVEGVGSCRAACKLAKKYGVSTPISECAHKILFEDMPANMAVAVLMERNKKNESEIEIL